MFNWTRIYVGGCIVTLLCIFDSGCSIFQVSDLPSTSQFHGDISSVRQIIVRGRRSAAQNRAKKTSVGMLPAIEHVNFGALDDSGRARRSRRVRRRKQGLSLWIDNKQVEELSGYPLEIYVIREGRVLPYVLDPNFNERLPIIPSQVSSFNFTWQGGRRRRYRYQFDKLKSYNRDVMKDPILSIARKGKLPRKANEFRIKLPCIANVSGIAKFSVRLKLKSCGNVRPEGMPISVTLRKRCAPIDPFKAFSCPVGYMGHNCSEALCYPHCMHGGVCVAPGSCSCPPGYHGRYCQGGICQEKCLNGGKCIQKDKCACSRGFYGDTCQYSKCVIPCINGGRCKGVNRCRCPFDYGGQHCEVRKWRGNLVARMQRCKKRCRNGECTNGECRCHQGYTGRWCRRKERQRRRRVWL